jgi:hypothetical protein
MRISGVGQDRSLRLIRNSLLLADCTHRTPSLGQVLLDFRFSGEETWREAVASFPKTSKPATLENQIKDLSPLTCCGRSEVESFTAGRHELGLAPPRGSVSPAYFCARWQGLRCHLSH